MLAWSACPLVAETVTGRGALLIYESDAVRDSHLLEKHVTWTRGRLPTAAGSRTKSAHLLQQEDVPGSSVPILSSAICFGTGFAMVSNAGGIGPLYREVWAGEA